MSIKIKKKEGEDGCFGVKTRFRDLSRKKNARGSPKRACEFWGFQAREASLAAAEALRAYLRTPKG